MCKQTDEYWMQMALEAAQCAAERGEIPVGAVMVRNGEAIAVTHNRCEELHDATAHAERLAVSEAGKRTGTWRLSGCTLYVTLEPCPMCMGALINARIDRIVYGAKDPHAGACESLLRLQSYPLEASPDCTGGVLEDEALQLLRSFFRARREIKK
ncbi:MAG: tRNA adenosine(34) deaminase TadA [Clostridia bacterium]|nr:tRNA adenosine(34) deaminase TadA [Clostridia bacterium]